jgi:hypothetical protein
LPDKINKIFITIREGIHNLKAEDAHENNVDPPVANAIEVKPGILAGKQKSNFHCIFDN